MFKLKHGADPILPYRVSSGDHPPDTNKKKSTKKAMKITANGAPIKRTVRGFTFSRLLARRTDILKNIAQTIAAKTRAPSVRPLCNEKFEKKLEKGE